MIYEIFHILNCRFQLKSSKLWSSQLWTRFKQLRIEAWKSQDFNVEIRWSPDFFRLGDGFYLVSSTFKMKGCTGHQKEAPRKIVVVKKDVFVSLPTGFGKAIIYEALPLILDHVTGKPGCRCRDAQIGLTKNQVQLLLSLGISAINISGVTPQVTAAKETNCVTSQT